MSFRRQNDYETRSDSLWRLRDRHQEIDEDSTYQIPRRDDLNHPTRSRRVLSPAAQRRQLTGDGKINNSKENRDYDFGENRNYDLGENRNYDLGENRNYDLGFSFDRNSHKQMMSKSLQFGLMKTNQVERGYMNEENYNDDMRGLEPDYLEDDTRTTRETLFNDSKLKDSSQYRRLSEELIRGSADILSNHGERRGNYGPSKESSVTRYYPEKIPVDRSLDMESHKERDNLVTYSRDACYYPRVVPSKDNGEGSFRYKDLEGTSSTNLRPNFSSSYMNGVPSCDDEYSRDHINDNVVGGLGSTSYGLNRQSYLSDLGCDSEMAHKYLGGYKGDINASPVRREGRGYLNSKNGREIDGLGYPSDECRRVGSEDQVDHKQDGFFRPDIRDTVSTHFDTREDSYGYLRSDAREHSTMKKQIDSVYCPGVSKSKASSEMCKEFADLESPYSQHDRRISKDHEVLHSGVIYDHDISPSWKSQHRFGREVDSSSHVESRMDLTSDFSFGRDAGPDYNSERVRGFRSNVDVDSYTERIRELPGFKYEDEMDVLSVSPCKPYQWENAAKEDITDRRLKNKYSDQQITSHNSRSALWSDTHDAYNRNEEWNDEDLVVQIPSRRLYDKNKPFQRNKRVFDRLEACEQVVTHEDILSSNDHLQNHSGIHSRLGNGPSKGLPWLGSLGHISNKKRPCIPDNGWIKEKEDNGIQSRLGNGPSKGLPWLGSLGHVSKKKKPSRPANVWIKEEDNGVGTINNDEPNKSERLVTSTKKIEPREDSEEFKKLVHKAFLSFSKKLNEDPSDRRSYKEQGRVGSLLCTVCGKSESKNFMDTKQLATHAFMSDKVGLRAQHLGLHKAICVLLGWQSVVAAPYANLYIPEPVSEEEALAQKEDLILWPPVVIVHTTSLSQDNAKLNIVDAVTEFLRGKGIGGNFKASVGRSAANQSTVVVLKYVGIFSNLQNAERIHKYFLDNKCGRVDFERRVASNKCSSTISSSNDDDKSSGSKEEEDGRKGGCGSKEEEAGRKGGCGSKEEEDGRKGGCGSKEEEDGRKGGCGSKEEEDGRKGGCGSKEEEDDGRKGGCGGEENSFYGYMGISEDLEVMDVETINKCLIKSKKEIQDLANAPIMPRN